MSFSFKLLSHPPSDSNPAPRLLKDHLVEVGNGAHDLIGSLPIGEISIDGARISKSQLEELAYIIGVSHDFGKGTSFFQKYLQTHLKGEMNRHAPISALFAFHLSRKLLNLPILSYIAFLTVYYHHGDLASPADNSMHLDKRQISIAESQARDILKGSFSEIEEIYKLMSPEFPSAVSEFLTDGEIRKDAVEIKRYVSRITGDRDSLENVYFVVMLMYSVLLYGDKMSASGIGYENAVKDRASFETIDRNLVDKYKETFKNVGNAELNELRDASYSDALRTLGELDLYGNRLLRIDLPTGMGKTTTALGVALEMRSRVREETGSTPRIIYALPFISIIDQNFRVFHDVLSGSSGYPLQGENLPSSLLLQHHHLSDVYYTFKGEGRPSDIDSVEPHELGRRYLLMEGWSSEIIVTTFVQFFHTLITNRNSSSMKFHSLVNSIIILDEVQAIPYKYRPLVIEMLDRFVHSFNSWVIMMTATMPDPFLRAQVTPLIPESQKYFDKMDRVVYRYFNSGLDLETLAKEYVMQREGKDVLVVVNTVQASKDLYAHLKNLLSQKHGNPEWNTEGGYCDFGSVVLTTLSTHLTPVDRMRRIKAIKNLDKCKIVISTQLIEAGVDLDMDVVIRDIAPVDSIVQAAGRANRGSVRGKGEVLIVRLEDVNRKEFARKIYDPFDIKYSDNILGKAFSDAGSETGLTERGLHKAVMDYYRGLTVKNDDASLKMSESIDTLNYGVISKFKMIEDEYPKVDVFIPVDRCAEVMWEEYTDSLLLPPIERKEKLLAFRNQFYQYVISVSRTFFEGVDDPVINPVIFSGKNVGDFYDKETGFITAGHGTGSTYAEW